MYRVILADDEEIIREGVARAVGWEALGLLLVAVAQDGEDALAQAKDLRPDIIITDIRMPRMDGLDLIRALREQQPNCKIVILTGHSEFDYARTALQLEVSDYLLKPVELMPLCRVLIRLRRELDTQHSEQSEIQLLHQQAQTDGRLKQQRLFRRYLAGQESAEELVASIAPRWRNTMLCAGVLVQIDDFDRLTEEMDEETIFTFTQRLETLLISHSNEEIQIIENDNGRYFVLFIGESEDELRFQIRSYIRRLRAATIQMKYTTIVSSVQNGGIAHCRQAYDEVQRCVDCAFLLGAGQDIYASETMEADFQSPLPAGLDMRRITQALAGFQKQNIHRELTEITESIRKTTHNSYLFTSMLVSFVYGEVIKLLDDVHCPIQSIMPEPMTAYSRLMACQSLDSMMGELLRILDDICDFWAENAEGNQNAVERAMVYMQEHYSNAKLSLDMVAAAVGISPTYLSALFKQNAKKQSFVSYLTEIRLNHAQYLLRSGDYRSYEVAYMCGYDNSTYFSTIFKRYVGISPSDYRRAETENRRNMKGSDRNVDSHLSVSLLK
ncbi:response regulator transcription factor [Butyricicoccus sp. Marseille-Q5471]|uniref:response regulator transcription factor n=1 Tax=Butyricicoccus sp. Marseille-Q5471 TaxID=3039493 RepID=UPI0024BBED1E|nr:response regulator [Butyricicoccus sp. Marseille-Q5471]